MLEYCFFLKHSTLNIKLKQTGAHDKQKMKYL